MAYAHILVYSAYSDAPQPAVIKRRPATRSALGGRGAGSCNMRERRYRPHTDRTAILHCAGFNRVEGLKFGVRRGDASRVDAVPRKKKEGTRSRPKASRCSPEGKEARFSESSQARYYYYQNITYYSPSLSRRQAFFANITLSLFNFIDPICQSLNGFLKNVL